jgi:Ca-activated chloride channel family protein
MLTTTQGYGVTCFCFLLTLPLIATPAQHPQPSQDGMTIAEATRGALLAPGDAPGRYRPLATLHTDVSMAIAGLVARVSVRQHFRNPSSAWSEAVYVFPLPDQAAVTRLRMEVGDRVIEGMVKERGEARSTYRQARAAGRRTALVEQERPNLFTTSVANIPPHGDIIVELEYVESLRYLDGRFHLRFPLVVGPRYIPGTPIRERARAVPGPAGWATATDAVPDAARISPPVIGPGQAPVNPVRIRFDLAAGLPLVRVHSPNHPVSIEHVDAGHARGELSQTTFADRDFELVWSLRADDRPRAAAFLQTTDDASYALIMVVPPNAGGDKLVPPRDLTLVLDTSGSMHGESLTQAVIAARLALDRLTPDDTFNLIRFNSRTTRLFPQARPATAAALASADGFLTGLRAQGGTEMAPALELALAPPTPSGRLRQVVFLTDGSVGNERHLFELISARIGNSRLFTVGIGSAPNAHFMRRAAHFGRGSFTFIGSETEVAEKMSTLFAMLAHPVLTDVASQWPGMTDVETWPQRIPDLYAGEPVVIAARMPNRPDSVRLTGRLGGQDWTFELPLPSSSRPGIATLWARAKLRGLMDREYGMGAEPRLRQQIVELALRHQLVSRYTSLVAVDVTTARPEHANLRSSAIPVNLPHGWSHAHVFGALPQTASGADYHIWSGLLCLLAATLLWFPSRRRTG